MFVVIMLDKQVISEESRPLLHSSVFSLILLDINLGI